MKKILRITLVLILGTLYVFIVSELGLKVIGYGIQEDRIWKLAALNIHPHEDINAYKYRILFIGNSFTKGDGAPPGASYPDHLQVLLDKAYSKKYLVKNAGMSNANTTTIKKNLPKLLEDFQPTHVIAMMGQSNEWNHAGFSEYLSSKNQKNKFIARAGTWFHSLRTVQFFSHAFYVLNERSHWFNDSFESDLAKINALTVLSNLYFNHFNFFSVFSSAELEESIISLKVIARDPEYGLAANLTISRLYAAAGNVDKAKEFFSIAVSTFDAHKSADAYFLYQYLSRVIRGEGEAEILALKDKISPLSVSKTKETSLKNWYYSGLFPVEPISRARKREVIALLAEAAQLWPYHLATYQTLFTLAYELREVDGMAAEDYIVPYLIQGLKSQPIPSRMDFVYILTGLRSITKAQRIRNLIDITLQEHFKKFPSQRFTFQVNDKNLIDWIKSDILSMKQTFAMKKIPFLLQTYPPQRRTNARMNVDFIIQNIASDLSLPISDTFSNLLKEDVFLKHKEKFYSMQGGDQDQHLNGAGYELVAKGLLEDIFQSGFIRKE